MSSGRSRGRLGASAAAWAILMLALPAAGAAANTPSPAHEFEQALAQARAGHLDAAYLLAHRAAKADPDNQIWQTASAVLRQRAVLGHLERAQALRAAGEMATAAVEFRTALALDPGNVDARQGLLESYPNLRPAPAQPAALRVENAAPPVEIEPSPGVRAFHLHVPLRAAVAEVSSSFGLRAYVADAVPDRSIRLDMDRANFAEAMAALRDAAGVEWIPLDAKTLYFTAAGQMRKVQPLAVRTFYVPWADTGVELNEAANVIRSLLGVTSISTDAAARALTLRATPNQVDAAETLLLDLGQPIGEVVLEVRILELNTTAARTLGVNIPDQFTMFALGPLLAQLQQNANQAQQILQLFEQGGLNAVLNSGTIPPGLLSQTQAISPLLQSPFVTFGGGITLMALSVPPLTATLSASNARVSSLETAWLRADSGQAAELKIGQKYPILNASFSPISLSPAISQVIGNGSFLQPFPSFTYEDLGLDAKITPEVETDGEVRLKVDLTVNGLTGESANNIPILSNRHVVTELGLKNGEPALLAGLLNQQEMRTLSGLPGISLAPGLGRLFSTQTEQTNRDQLALLVVPHVVRLPRQLSAGLWLPADFAPMSGTGAPEPSPLQFQRPLQPRLPFGPGRAGGGGGR